MDRDSVSWTELTQLTRGETFEVERVRIKRSGIALEGRFELPALVQMSGEDQVFVAAFLRSHGSIKEMERLFGISYPTVKARLTKIAEQLPFVETVASERDPVARPRPSRKSILEQVDEGKIDVAEAVRLLRERGEE